MACTAVICRNCFSANMHNCKEISNILEKQAIKNSCQEICIHQCSCEKIKWKNGEMHICEVINKI